MNSLGIDKPVEKTRVVVAMSGGVDSSVAAAMLKAEGYEVIGITLQLYDYGAAVAKPGKTCCAGQDIHDARRVAEEIDIPHYVLNYEDKFKEAVMEDFVDSYLAGQTPIPCVRCNQSVKFKDLLQMARDLGADVMATGHYVQQEMTDSGKSFMLRGADDTKDQSYFLFATTQEQLDFLRFPLGDKTKAETRALAEQYGLQVSDKPDSQDICFVPTGGYAKVVEKLRPGASAPGAIIHIETGEVLGQHKGIIHYTVGQRRGLDIGGTQAPLYVVKLNADDKTVLVGPQDALLTQDIALKEVNWLGEDVPQEGKEVLVKLRSVGKPVSAKLQLIDDAGHAQITLTPPQMGTAPGQACVFYEGNRVLGGGWIKAA
ncbi:MAG: tRNA 2-thiouridine(34) synthase MnmA [Rickettsiales bacterium]|nr:tRNA 2-thiouridine(34) synthase MnmA [Rickettsiales bacterium]